MCTLFGTRWGPIRLRSPRVAEGMVNSRVQLKGSGLAQGFREGGVYIENGGVYASLALKNATFAAKHFSA